MWQKILNRETITYFICGVLTTLVSMGIFILCMYFQMRTAAANTVSTVLAVLFAFFLNKTI